MSRRAGQKRTRSLLDAVASVDELLGTTQSFEYNTIGLRDDDEEDARSDSDDVPFKKEKDPSLLRAVPLDAGERGGFAWANRIDSPPREVSALELSGSLGGAEMALLNRKEEELADMVLFLSRTLRRVCTPASFYTLVQHVASHGARPVLIALKHAGTQVSFFHALCEAPVNGRHFRAALLRFFAILFSESDAEVFYDDVIVRFLVRCLSRHDEDEDDDDAVIAADGGDGTASPERTDGRCGHGCDEGSRPRADGHAPSRQLATERSPKPHWSASRKSQTASGAAAAASSLTTASSTPTNASLTRHSSPTRVPADEERAAWRPCVALLETLAQKREGAVHGEVHGHRADGDDVPSSTFAVAVRVLLELVLSQNQERVAAVRGGVPSVPRLFAAAGGLNVLCARLEKDAAVTPASTTTASSLTLSLLSLLEVLTVSTTCSPDNAGSLLGRVTVAVWHTLQRVVPLTTLAASSAAARESQAAFLLSSALPSACLRVLTNVTNLDATVLRAPAHRHEEAALAEWLSTLLTHASATTASAHGGGGGIAANTDVLAFAVCCAVNLVKYEAKHGCSAEASFTSAFVWAGARGSGGIGDGAPLPVLTALAHTLFACYLSDSTEETVLSGYYALLLAVLSLVQDDPDNVLAVVAPLNLRVRVITAVADATRATPLGERTRGKPMTLIVVVLQEFMLFQSTSGTLTRDALVEMTGVVDQLVAANLIEVSSDGGDAQ